MKPTFKIRLTNEPKDEHLEMNLLYHVPVSRLAEVVEYLEKVAPRKITTPQP
jgi:hypothetical protein